MWNEYALALERLERLRAEAAAANRLVALDVVVPRRRRTIRLPQPRRVRFPRLRAAWREV
jgi:hypothetical protein